MSRRTLDRRHRSHRRRDVIKESPPLVECQNQERRAPGRAPRHRAVDAGEERLAIPDITRWVIAVARLSEEIGVYKGDARRRPARSVTEERRHRTNERRVTPSP